MVSERVVLWDFDGTLAHRPGRWSGCLMDCLHRACGSDLSLDDVRAQLSEGFPWHEPEHGHGHLADPDAWWAHLRDVLSRALRRAGAGSELTARAVGYVREHYTDPGTWDVLPDAHASLAAVSRAGWRNAVLSNHVPEVGRLIAELGLASHLEAVFSSATIGWEKPNPRAFRYALRELGDPVAVWMVGDSLDADVRGAEAAGIPAILVGADGAAGLSSAVRSILDTSPGPSRVSASPIRAVSGSDQPFAASAVDSSRDASASESADDAAVVSMTCADGDS
jgi:putative hydrolase of the HAD superfamily